MRAECVSRQSKRRQTRRRRYVRNFAIRAQNCVTRAVRIVNANITMRTRCKNHALALIRFAHVITWCVKIRYWSYTHGPCSTFICNMSSIIRHWRECRKRMWGNSSIRCCDQEINSRVKNSLWNTRCSIKVRNSFNTFIRIINYFILRPNEKKLNRQQSSEFFFRERNSGERKSHFFGSGQIL